MAIQAVNPIWRNNYLMGARELDGTLDRDALFDTLRAMGNPDIAASMPIPLLLRAVATRINPARSVGTHVAVAIHCADSGVDCGLDIRSEVAEVLADSPADAAIVIQTTEPTLRGVLMGRVEWARAVADGTATLTRGTEEAAVSFWGLFDPPGTEIPALALR